MKNGWKCLASLAIALGLALIFALPAAAQNPAGVITYRQKIMGSMSGHLGGIGQILKNKLPYKDHIKRHAQAIAAMAALIPEVFPKGTGEGKTDALPAIWEDKATFDAAARNLAKEARKLAKVADTGDLSAIGKQAKATGKDGCGGCHKDFRQPKKKRKAWLKK